MVPLLAEFGLAALFFLAGLEIDFARVGGRVLRRSLLGWVCPRHSSPPASPDQRDPAHQRQFAMRFVIVVVAGLVALSIALRLDMLPGACTAGVVVRLLLCRASEDDRRLVETKLEAVGFGFVVPVFFIARGLSLDST